jgi:hypothetical protein
MRLWPDGSLFDGFENRCQKRSTLRPQSRSYILIIIWEKKRQLFGFVIVRKDRDLTDTFSFEENVLYIASTIRVLIETTRFPGTRRPNIVEGFEYLEASNNRSRTIRGKDDRCRRRSVPKAADHAHLLRRSRAGRAVWAE